MKAIVEIRHKVTLLDKKGNYEQAMMQIRTEEGLREKINVKKIERYFEIHNAITIPLPSGEVIKVYIEG